MRQEHWNKIIDYFGVMVKSSADRTPSMNTIQSINNYACKMGYIIQPEACTDTIRNWLNGKKFNPNTTFYRAWRDITDKSRMQLFLDQLLHYASTYGTDYQGEVYCPNGEPINIDYEKYCVIRAVSDEELEKLVMNALASGIALNSDVVEAFCEYLLLLPQAINIDAIKNREAMVYICSHLGIFPTNPETLVRYIFYITTGAPMLIQSPEMLSRIRYNSTKVDLSMLTREQLIGLASVFNRYKKIFMQLKTNPDNVNAINRISRLSKKHHKPFCVGFWENITNIKHISDELLDRKVVELTNPFKIIKLLEMIKLRQVLADNNHDRMFIIRNGKIWVDRDSMVPYPTDFDRIGMKLLGRLVKLMGQVKTSTGNKTISLPACTLACPSSEKKFVGNLPMGSYYDLKDHDNYFGIYWRNEWGTHDFDLSFIHDGRKVGWNADYVSDGITFSGDMTNAEPEATEMFRIKSILPNGTIYVNRYNGMPGSQFKLFFGQDKCNGFKKNYMVNPNSIILEDMMESDVREKMVGQVIGGRVYFLNLGTGNRTISVARDTDYVNAQCVAHIELRPLLEAVGYEIVPKGGDIDLSTPSKEKILNLFVTN